MNAAVEPTDLSMPAPLIFTDAAAAASVKISGAGIERSVGSTAAFIATSFHIRLSVCPLGQNRNLGKPRSLGQAKHDVEHLHRLSGGAFD